MKKAYIIIAHKLPDQVYRLVERLDDNLSVFFIHIDVKIDISQFCRLSNFGNKIRFTKRESSKWGSMRLVKAMLNAFNDIKDSKENFERIILLSGQDYPIKSNEYINNFFRTSPHSVFMEHWRIPNYEIWKLRGGMFRVDKYFLGVKKYEKFVARTINFLSILFPPLRRKLPYNLLPYGGWMWWTIDMYALKYILLFIKDHPKYIRFHKYSFIPDEMFIHTILLNSKDEKLLKSIDRNHLRYIVWNERSKAHPVTLRKANYNDIKESKSLYARKFDYNIDGEILDLIDSNCLT